MGSCRCSLFSKIFGEAVGEIPITSCPDLLVSASSTRDLGTRLIPRISTRDLGTRLKDLSKMKEVVVQTHPESEVALQELLHLVYSASCHDYMVTWEYVTLRSNQYGLPHGIHGNFFLSSGTTDILLQPEIYAAVIAQLKLVRFYRPNIGQLCWQRDFRLISRRISCP